MQENIKSLEHKLEKAEDYAKDLEKGFEKQMNQVKSEKMELENQIKKMNSSEQQKEAETNNLVKHTLEDLKKYQSMDQMKEEEADELRNQTTVLSKQLEQKEKAIKNLDSQLSLSMKRSMKVISQLNENLIEAKNKEVTLLGQVVDAKQKVVREEKSVGALHQSLLEQSDKAYAETVAVAGQQKTIDELNKKLANVTQQMKEGQAIMEKQLKAAVEDAKKIGYAEGSDEQREFYKLANEEQSLAQSNSLLQKQAEMDKLSTQQMKLQDELHNAKLELNATQTKKAELEKSISQQTQNDKNLTDKVAAE